MRTNSLSLVLGALAAALLVASASTADAHDAPGPHIHVKGRVVTSDGQPLKEARVRAIDQGVFPGIPGCQVRSQFEFRYNPDGSYELVLFLEGQDRAGRRIPECPEAFAASSVAVDKGKIRWEAPGATIVPR